MIFGAGFGLLSAPPRDDPMNATLPRILAKGHELDLSEGSFGELRRSNDVAGNAAALRQRLVVTDSMQGCYELLDASREQVAARGTEAA